MGGMGSGGWNRTGRPATVDAYTLDVNRLRKAGVLVPGWFGGWQWSRNGEKVADIRIRTTEADLVLIYRTRPNGGPWRDVEQPVAITWSPCRFGGRRPFLCCPRCGRQSAKLFLLGDVLCRTCHGLVYPSQRERDLDRAFRRADNIRMKLGGPPGVANPFPEKPKGMHWTTYNRLSAKVLDDLKIIAEGERALMARLDRKCKAVLTRYGEGGFWI